ncbi:MAG TPA: hypothetical protein VK473_00470 [Terriglobales bacterium]|nr:hypothetical protein [Terriglobales bacterium]
MRRRFFSVSSRVLFAGLLCAAGSGMSTNCRAQSLGDVAAESKAKVSGSHRVFTDEDMSDLRDKTRASAAEGHLAGCDRACEEKVKAGLGVANGDAGWSDTFHGAVDAVTDDAEWQDLFARVKAENCQEKHSGKVDAEASKSLLQELQYKVERERHDLLEMRRDTVSLPIGSPEIKTNMAQMRTRAVKVAIMAVQLTGLANDTCKAAAN